jgi:hypothetical protein
MNNYGVNTKIGCFGRHFVIIQRGMQKDISFATEKQGQGFAISRSLATFSFQCSYLTIGYTGWI